MQPCAVCGGVTVDATGHCTLCGAFRGNEAPPAYPAGQPYDAYQRPVSGSGYPTTGAPYGPPADPGYGYPPGGAGHGYPTSGPAYPPQAQPQSAAHPGAAYPASPAGAYPASGAGYPGGPGYPPSGPPARGRAFLMPLLALSATLVVLVVAIVVVVLVKGGGDDPGPGPVAGGLTPSPGRSSAGSPDVDPCVVGRWQLTEHREDVALDSIGKVRFVGGRGATVSLDDDGSGVTDYGSGTSYEGEAEGRTIKLVISGRINFDFTARSGTLALSDVRSTGRFRLYIDDEQYGTEQDFEGSDDPTRYECSGDRLVQRTALMEVEFRRL